MHRESKNLARIESFLVWILVTSLENQQYTILAFTCAYLITLIELIIADKNRREWESQFLL